LRRGVSPIVYMARVRLARILAAELVVALPLILQKGQAASNLNRFWAAWDGAFVAMSAIQPTASETT
jgi:hypothetical protein